MPPSQKMPGVDGINNTLPVTISLPPDTSHRNCPGRAPLLVCLRGLLHGSVHPVLLLVQMLTELGVEVVQDGFLDPKVFDLFSEPVIDGQDGVKTDGDLGRGKQKVCGWRRAGSVLKDLDQG